MDGLSIDKGVSQSGVQHNAAVAQLVLTQTFAPAAPENGLGLGYQNGEGEGLGKVVVRPYPVALQGVFLLSQGGKKENGH